MKKFLIISSYAPPMVGGAPISMLYLLKHFPKNAYTILTSSLAKANSGKPNPNKLPVKYYFFDHKHLFLPGLDTKKSLTNKLKIKIQNNSFIKTLLSGLLLLTLTANAILQGKKIIKKDSIQIILAFSDSGPALLASLILHKLTNNPLYVHLFDPYKDNRLPFFHRLLAKLLEPQLFKSAEKIFVINEYLAEHYKLTYSCSPIIIHNPSPTSRTLGTKKHKSPTSKTIKRIIYTGTIYWAQIEAIKRVAQSIESIPNLELWLYTPHTEEYLKSLGIEQNTKIHFSFTDTNISEIQASADILLIALSFNTKFSFLINTASPGKTYEYLLSQKPILIHAPKTTYITQYATIHNFATTVTNPDPNEITKTINELLSKPELVKKITTNALFTAQTLHNDQKISKFFQSHFL